MSIGSENIQLVHNNYPHYCHAKRNSTIIYVRYVKSHINIQKTHVKYHNKKKLITKKNLQRKYKIEV